MLRSVGAILRINNRVSPNFSILHNHFHHKLKNMKAILISLLILLSSNLAFSQNTTISKAREIIAQMVEEENIVGLSISVSQKDSLLWSEGFGFCDMNKETAITPNDTYFRIASLSKPITATLMGRLYEENIIDPDESLYTYVPNFPKKEYDFTVKHLATHQSGIRHYKGLEKENKKPLSLEEGLDRFKNSKLKFKPGTAYNYSSYGYNLLGVAIQNAANTPFQDLLKSYVTEPLEMNHTIPDNGNYKDMKTSGFFMSNGKGKIKEADEVNLFMKLPSGGMLSTSEDLVRLGNAYVYKRILKEATQNLILEDITLPNGKKTGYGMGWGLSTDKKGRKILSHNGGNTGSVCRLIIYPEEELTIAVVSNTFGIDWVKFIRNMWKVSAVFLN